MTSHRAEGDRDAVFDSGLTGCYLIAHKPHRVGIGAYEDEIVGLACFGQFRTLGEESIAGMYGIDAGIQGGIDNLADIEIGVF